MTPDGKIDVEKTDAAFKAALPATAPKPYTDLFNKIIINCTTSVPCTSLFAIFTIIQTYFFISQ